MEQHQLFEAIREEYREWYEFMYEQVSFSMWNSRIHGIRHCANVLRFALMIAEAKGLSQSQRETLAAAAVFHDSRRQSEGRDREHGRRSAEYYRDFCEHTGMEFDPVCFEIIVWHSRSMETGRPKIEEACPDREDAILLYKIFKDADSLDLFRLDPYAVDADRLRTPEATALFNYARELSGWFVKGSGLGNQICSDEEDWK